MFRASIPYAVIGVVAKQKDHSVQSLHKYLMEKWVTISLPNFYKIIAHMIDDQILVKPRWKVQLHALFMRYIFGLSEDSQKVYQGEEVNVLQKLAPGQQETREESNLYDLNVIRMDLLCQLIKMNPWSPAYHYTSHPYYILWTPDKEVTNMEEIANAEEKSQMLIGNTTFLDRHGADQLSKHYFTTKCVNDTPFPQEGYSVDIIGDYIVECMLPTWLSEHFSLFFNSILWVEGYKKDLFCQVLKMKAPCSLKLIYSPEHAKKMKAKIQKSMR